MAKFELKIKARNMRKEGISLGTIARTLGVSKSSVSLWCRDIVLSEDQILSLNEFVKKRGLKGRLLGAEGNRRKKREVIVAAKQWAKNKIQHITNRDLFMTGIALYWGEGIKGFSAGGFGFNNSDHQMIVVMCKWLRMFFIVTLNEMTFRVSINEMHTPRIEKVKSFWSELLGINTQDIAVTFVCIPQKKVYENYDTYYGVLSLRVKKGTVIKYKVLALIESLILESV